MAGTPVGGLFVALLLTSCYGDRVDMLLRKQRTFESWVMQDVSLLNDQMTKIQDTMTSLSQWVNTSLHERGGQPIQNSQHNNQDAVLQLSTIMTRLRKAFEDHKLSISNQIAKLSHNISSVFEEDVSTHARLTDHESRLKTLENTTDGIEERLDDVENDVKSTSVLIDDELRTARDNLNNAMKTIQNEMAVFQKSLETNKEVAASMETKLESKLEAKLMANIDAKLEAKQSKEDVVVKALDAKIDRIRQDLRSDIQTAIATQQEVMGVNQQHGRRLDTLNKRVESVEREMTDSTSQLKTQLSQIQSAQTLQLQEGARTRAHEHLRLVGPSWDRGRVEIFYKGEWGTICGYGFQNRDATVVCRMLGYTKGVDSDEFGPGSGPIWLGIVRCSGAETNIFDCRRSEIGRTRGCSHRADVGVVCS